MNVPFTCPRTCPLVNERWCRFRPVLDLLGTTKVDSHVAQVDVVIKDLQALKAACKQLGLEFKEGQKTYKWFGRSVGDYPIPAGMRVEDLGKCVHAIGLKDNKQAYEIGIIVDADGNYRLVWDFWSGGYGLEAAVGKDCQKLRSEYAFGVAEQSCKNLGWLTERQSNGELIVHHPSGGQLTIQPGGKLEAFGFQGVGCHEAMMSLNLPLTDLTAKPENGQIACQVTQTK